MGTPKGNGRFCLVGRLHSRSPGLVPSPAAGRLRVLPRTRTSAAPSRVSASPSRTSRPRRCPRAPAGPFRRDPPLVPVFQTEEGARGFARCPCGAGRQLPELPSSAALRPVRRDTAVTKAEAFPSGKPSAGEKGSDGIHRGPGCGPREPPPAELPRRGGLARGG